MDVKTLVIACDESGSEGENLTRAGSRVFSHATVSLPSERAYELMQTVRASTGDRSAELKSRVLIDHSNRDVLKWFLAESPVVGRGLVNLTDKHYFVCSKLVDLIVEEHMYAVGHDLFAHGRARAMAFTLFIDGPAQFGDRWRILLDQFNVMLRRKVRSGPVSSLDDFYATLDELRPEASGKLALVLRLIHAGRAHAEQHIESIEEASVEMLALDPLFAALGSAARTWHDRVGLPVEMVHDATSALTDRRIASLKAGLRPAATQSIGLSPVPLVKVTLADSKSDPRVQVADLLAGAAREIATRVLAQSDEGLADLLRPYVDGSSLWGDLDSWNRLTGVSHAMSAQSGRGATA